MASAQPHVPPIARSDRHWPLWPLVPLYPYGQRSTLCREVVPQQVWVFEQIQGIFYVTVPIRMTVVRLEAGGLGVYGPIAPTQECIQHLRRLENRWGTVRWIIFPTASGLEHKVFVAPFARRFPQAQVLVVPQSWSFPVNLPLSWLGLPASRTQVLDPQGTVPGLGQSPLPKEVEYAVLGPMDLGLGPFVEVTLFHGPSRSLLVTDALVSIPQAPPAVIEADPYPLLFHSRDRGWDPIEDSPDQRRQGWQRINLFAFYFRPAALSVLDTGESLALARQAPTGFVRRPQNYFGWLPWAWEPEWRQSFQRLCQGEAVQVAPILQTLILNRNPQRVRQWLDQVCQWPFERVIPAHMQAPVSLTPQGLRQAFSFLDQPDSIKADQNPDRQFLWAINDRLVQSGILPPPQQ